MWVLWLMGLAALGGAIFLLLRASQHMANPKAHRNTVLAVAGGVAVVLFGPPLWRAVREDPWGALTTVVTAALVVAAVWFYAKVIRKAHARARRED